MAHLVEAAGLGGTSGAASLFAAAAAMELECGEEQQDYSLVSRAAALVSPTEQEFELLVQRVRDLMEEGRGETIYEVRHNHYPLPIPA